jgi:hypothetical protein
VSSRAYTVVLASPVCARISMKAVARMGMKAVTMVLTSVWLRHLQSSVRRLRLGRDRLIAIKARVRNMEED